MRSYFSFSKKQSEVGQGLVEYGLILVLVSVVCIVILSAMGSGVADVFCKVTGALGGGGETVTVSGNTSGSSSHSVELSAGQTINISTTTPNSYIVNVTLWIGGSPVAGDNDQAQDGQATFSYTAGSGGVYTILVQTAVTSGNGAPSAYELTYSTC